MNGWTTKLLGKLAKSVEYGVTASATQKPIGPKFLRITDIQNGVVNWETVPWCECDARTASEARLKSGDIVFARTGATTGKSFLIGVCPDNTVFASYLIRVRLRDGAEPRFVSHFFQTPSYWAQITKSARGVAQPGVNATKLKALEIPLPSMAEQRRIADVLDRAAALRATRRVALAELDTLRQSIFLDLFGDPVHNEKSWPVYPLLNVAMFENGDRSSNYPSGDEIKNEGILFLSTKNIVEDRLDLSNAVFITPEKFQSLARGKVQPKDLIVTLRGTLGSCCIFDCSYPTAFINAQMMIIRPRDGMNSVFLHGLLTSKPAKLRFQRIGHGVAIPQLTAAQLANLPIPVPPVELQLEFARRVESVENLKETQRASLAQMDALFASLQHRAFRGEL